MVAVRIQDLQVAMPLLHERLRARRIEQGLTQNELAQRVGVKQSQIVSWEQGLYDPKIGTVKRMAEVLEVTVD